MAGTNVSTTFVEISNAAIGMHSKASASEWPEETQRSMALLERRGMTPEVPVGVVAAKIVAAVRKGRGYVRLPYRNLPMLMLAGLPRWFSARMLNQFVRGTANSEGDRAGVGPPEELHAVARAAGAGEAH